MAKNNNLTDFLTGIADAIRTKKGSSSPINPQNFEREIAGISTSKLEQEKSVTPTTAVQEVTPDSGKVLSKVTVAATPLQTKAGTPGKVSKTYTPDAGYVGLESFQIEAVPTKDETIVSNGTYSPDPDTFFGDITVNVPAYENVTTSADMEAKLVAANVGKVYRADFTNDTYTFGDLYEVVSG